MMLLIEPVPLSILCIEVHQKVNFSSYRYIDACANVCAHTHTSSLISDTIPITDGGIITHSVFSIYSCSQIHTDGVYMVFYLLYTLKPSPYVSIWFPKSITFIINMQFINVQRRWRRQRRCLDLYRYAWTNQFNVHLMA